MAKITHSLIAHDGKYICMPPHKLGQSGWDNMAEPNVHAAGGDTSGMVYPINTKFVDFDRTFIYGYCSTKYNAAVKSNLGMFNENTPINGCTWGGVAGAVGDTVCPFLTSDLTGYTDVDVNEFAGGYMMPRAGGIAYGGYRIASNTVYAGGHDGTTETDFVIEEPGLGAIVTASAAYCYLDKNPFTAVRSNWLGPDTIKYASAVGVSLIDPTASTYQWFQTWGPIHMLGGEQAGKAAYLREQYFAYDGSLIAGAQGDHTTSQQLQTAGYLLAWSYVSASGVYGALLQLQLQR